MNSPHGEPVDVSVVTDDADNTIVRPSSDRQTTVDNKITNCVELAPDRFVERARGWRVREPRAGDHVFCAAVVLRFLVAALRVLVAALRVLVAALRVLVVVAVFFFATAVLGRAGLDRELVERELVERELVERDVVGFRDVVDFRGPGFGRGVGRVVVGLRRVD